MRHTLLAMLLLLPQAAVGGEREDTIQRLMEAQGLIQTFEQQLALGREQSKQRGKAMLDQVMASLHPTPEFSKRFESVFETFLAEIRTPWGAEEIVQVWSRYYGEQFTDSELNELLSFYSSPLAQKEVVVSRDALSKLSGYFADRRKPIDQKAIDSYIVNLRAVATECNCRTTGPSASSDSSVKKR